MRHPLLVSALLIALLGACDVPADSANTTDVGDSRDVGGESDVGGARDVGGELGADVSTPDASERDTDLPDTPPDTPPDDGVLALEPSTGELALDFRVDIEGSGGGELGAVSVVDNLATVEIGGEVVEGFVYERQPWATFNLILYQTFLLTEDRFYVLWFYCEEGALTSIWYEGTSNAPLTNVTGSGACTETLGPSATAVTTPRVRLPEPAPIGGYAVSGPEITIEPGEVGEIVLGGARYDAWVFEEVDCSAVCGSPGWYELHAVIAGQEDTSLGFAIVYLRENGDIQAYYGIVLPEFAKLPGRTFEGEWELR